jgi:hypothetical protein
VTSYPTWAAVIAWTLLVAGLGTALSTLSQPAGLKRGYMRLTGYALLGASLLLGGICGVLFNVEALHVTVRGQLFRVAIHTGGKSSDSQFCLRVPSGEVDGLYAESALYRLEDGTNAEIVYQSGTKLVLQITLLDGPYTGYIYSGSDDFYVWLLATFAGIVLAAYGVWEWLNDRNGEPPVPDHSNNQEPPSDVDTRSLLNLS